MFRSAERGPDTGSDSRETVEFTHANYFDGSVAVSKYLVGL